MCIVFFHLWLIHSKLFTHKQIKLFLQPAQLIQGPTVEMNLEEAISLIDVLRLSKKFAFVDVQNVLFQISQSKNPRERSQLLKMAINEKSLRNKAGNITLVFIGIAKH